METSTTNPTQTPGPILARLSFLDVPPERMAEFEAAYEAKVAPILKKHGLVEPSEQRRLTLRDVFSRLFEVGTPSEVAEKRRALQDNPEWREALQNVGMTFGIPLFGNPCFAQENCFDDVARLTDREFQLLLREISTKDCVIAFRGASQELKVRLYSNVSERVRKMIADEMEIVGPVSESDIEETRARIVLTMQQFIQIGQTTWPPSEEKAPEHKWLPELSEEYYRELMGRLQHTPLSRPGFDETTKAMMDLCTIARREGIFACEKVVEIINDELLQQGMRWAVDGFDPEAVQEFLQIRTQTLMHEHETKYRMILRGIIYVQTGTSPRFVEDKLRVFYMAARQDERDSYGKVSISDLKDKLQRTPFSQFGLDEITDIFTDMAIIAQNEGIRALDEIAEIVKSDDLFQNGFYLAMDGTEAELVQKMLEARMKALLQDHRIRYNMITEGIFLLQTGGSPQIVEQKLRNLYESARSADTMSDGHEEDSLRTYDVADGLAGADVRSILQDQEGHLWFGTNGGVCRYDGQHFKIFTTGDGLAKDHVWSTLEDQRGHLWFGTRRGGVSRYDGKSFVTFTTQDGLAGDWVYAILEDRKGHLWIGTNGGVSRYDGQRFTSFTTKDGLAGNHVCSILEDRKGNLWFGTYGKGTSRFDGKQFFTFSKESGLADQYVLSIVEDREGVLWFGTYGGVSRFDGHDWVTFTEEDGLASNWVQSVMQDREGHLWFGTWGGGISRYDGLICQNLLRQDGLSHNSVRCTLQDRDGDVWIATERGITRYCPLYTPPPIHIVDVITDRKYGPVTEIRVPDSQRSVCFEFEGVSSKTRPGQMAYVYRLDGYNKDWLQTRDGRVEYTDLPLGDYVFQVKAVDRDLVYSEEPARVRLKIVQDTRDAQIDELERRVRERTLELEETHQKLQEAQAKLIAELEKELQTAHDLQMGMMSHEKPQIEGFDIAGRCLPANHVGGDFFKYFALPNGRVAGVLADVTGHAMEAAVPMLMFSGVLESQMELGGTMEDLFHRLNRSLHRTLPGRTFVCLEMGELDPSTRRLRLSNSGCPYPYHFRAVSGEVAEIPMDAYPLGVRPDTEYPVLERQLHPGDRVVFCSDGVIEAANGAGEQFGYERTVETIRKACEEGLSAEATIDRLMKEVEAFRGDAPQSDDITCVVVRVRA